MCACVERVDFVRLLLANRQHDDRRLRPLPHAACDIDAADPRQPEIQDDEIGANGSITRKWKVAGGYAYQDAFVTGATTAARANPAGRNA